MSGIRKLLWTLMTVSHGLMVGCAGGSGELGAGGQSTNESSRTASVEFAELVTRFSEAGGFFDTDNLISNETSYLHVMGGLQRRDVRGGAYLGVGPAQNFSYIAQIKPELAFIVDIRRDNMLQHLMFKALFSHSPTRSAYLANLTGREIRAPDSRTGSIAEIVASVDAAPAVPDVAERAVRRVLDDVAGFGLALSPQDIATIERFHRTFIGQGLDLRFTSFGRAPQPYYPTLRQLLLETDLAGNQANYLGDDESYQFVRSMQRADKIIPVVGNLAGHHALTEIGSYLKAHDLTISAFYTSNVEFYLMRDGSFPSFVQNVIGLPIDDRSTLIHSYFGGFSRIGHPLAVPGYYSVQLLHSIQTFVTTAEAGGWSSHYDFMTRDAVPLR